MRFADSFRAARWIRLINLVLQSLLFTALFSGLNYLALHYSWRYDLTQHRRHSLSPETLSYLKGLRAPVQIVVTWTEDSENEEVAQIYRDVSGILREYVYATANNRATVEGASYDGRITTRYIDVFRQRREAESLGIEQANSIQVMSGNNRRTIGLEELYRFENKQKQEFRGEQALTAAILDVDNSEPTKIYVLRGNGEMQLDKTDAARGLSALKDEMRARNFDLQPLDLSVTKSIPADAALLIIAAPEGPYDKFEVELIRTWMTRSPPGRLIILLAPRARHGLESLLSDWGLVSDDVVVYDNGATGQDESGNLILRSLSKESPITAMFLANEMPLRFGQARAARPDPTRARDGGFDVKPLVATTESAWGERSYRMTSLTQRYDAGVDLPGPIVVAASSERVTPPNDDVLPFSVRGGRVVLFGGADFIANGRITNPANLGVFLNSVNWTTDRDTQLNIPPRPIERFQLSLSQDELSRLRYSLLLGVPGAAALLGLIVYWTRRR
ncbi:MAG: GldG family protein [Opitutaceae bacterium]|nr:GldG family protein [Opitutaceae bacterium]